MLCRVRVLSRKTPPAPPFCHVRHISRALTRPAPPLTVRGAPRLASTRRYSETTAGSSQWQSASERLDQEGIPTPLEPHEYRQIIARAKKVWPCPPSVPAGWSCKWEDWKYLLTFYWLSPYYLMLPQIEMAVNIRHAIRGETRPLLFSNERQAFVFTLVDSPRKFFLFDGANGALYRFMSVGSEQALVHLMGQGDAAIQERLHLVKPSPEGEEAVQRILARDSAVIPLLTDKFLDYTPVATKPWEEGHLSEVDELPDEEELAAQIEKHEALVKALAAKKGVDISEQLLIDEYEEDEDEDDDDDDDDGIDGLEEELKKLLDMKVDLQKLVEEAEARGAH